MVPNLFGTRDLFHGRQFFHGPGQGDGLGMIQAHYLYCAVYFCYYYISSTSDHQVLDPGGWGPLLYTKKNREMSLREHVPKALGLPRLTCPLSQKADAHDFGGMEFQGGNLGLTLNTRVCRCFGKEMPPAGCLLCSSDSR